MLAVVVVGPSGPTLPDRGRRQLLYLVSLFCDAGLGAAPLSGSIHFARAVSGRSAQALPAVHPLQSGAWSVSGTSR